MKLFKEILAGQIKPTLMFFRREFAIEFKKPAGFFGVLLYQICSAFIMALLLRNQVTPNLWSALFWIVMLFSGFSLVGKNLNSDEESKLNYIFTLVGPITYINAKILFHSLFLMLLTFSNFILMSVWMKNPIETYDLFLLSLILGSFGFGIILTLLASLCTKANNPTTLMAILGFPLLIPYLWTLIRISVHCINGAGWNEMSNLFFYLISIDVIALMMTLILFPQVWQD